MGWERVYHVSYAFRSTYGRSDETGEDGGVKEGSDIPGEGEGKRITWLFVFR